VIQLRGMSDDLVQLHHPAGGPMLLLESEFLELLLILVADLNIFAF